MSLYDSIKEVTEEENKLAGKNVAAEEKEPTPLEVQIAHLEAPDVKAAEGVKDEAKKAGEAGAEDTKTPAAAPENPTAEDFAKLRYEAAQAKRRADAAEAKLKQAPTQPQPGPAHTTRTAVEKAVLAEPDPNLDPEAHLRWELAQTKEQLKAVVDWKASVDADDLKEALKDGAVKAYSKYEEDFSPTVPDYGAVTTFGIQAIARSIQTLNPALQGEELQEAIKHQVLRLGAQAEARGEDPAEFFYRQSKAWGYKPAPPEPTAAEKAAAEKKPAPTIKEIAEHKRKSATSLTPGGKSGAPALSREEAMKMTPADWQRLTPGQLRELEAMG